MLLPLAFGMHARSAQTHPANPSAKPTFYRDVLPILQDHCQVCHRAGEIAPMPLVTYQQTRAYAAAIKQTVHRGRCRPGSPIRATENSPTILRSRRSKSR